VAYAAIMVFFAYFWNDHADEMVHFKGGDILYAMYFCVIVFYIFSIVLYASIKKINTLWFIFSPLIVAVVSAFVAAAMLIFTTGNNWQRDITFYILSYCVVGLAAMTVLWLHVPKKSKAHL